VTSATRPSSEKGDGETVVEIGMRRLYRSAAAGKTPRHGAGGFLTRQRISLPVDETIDISTNDEPVWRVGL